MNVLHEADAQSLGLALSRVIEPLGVAESDTLGLVDRENHLWTRVG